MYSVQAIAVILSRWRLFLVAYSSINVSSSSLIFFKQFSLMFAKMVYGEKEKVDSKFEVSYMQLMCLIKCSHGFLSTLTSWVSIVDGLKAANPKERCPLCRESIEFVKDLIVTPPTGCEQTELERNFPPTVKRNLSKVFDAVAKGKANIPFKKLM
ncbi:hypothetical protein QL285_072706 [Trifolium repens]|nr:hypothetical protein QL285_072706 [Trifolium repens]